MHLRRSFAKVLHCRTQILASSSVLQRGFQYLEDSTCTRGCRLYSSRHSVTAHWAWQWIIPKFRSASCRALQLGFTIPLWGLANEKPLASPVKKKQVPVSVYKLLASLWAWQRLCTLEIPGPRNCCQDWGIGISGTDELPVEWYNPEAKLVGRYAVRQSGSIAQHAAQSEASTTPANQETQAAAVPSWCDQLANAMTAGIPKNGPGNIEVCIASIKKISFD